MNSIVVCVRVGCQVLATLKSTDISPRHSDLLGHLREADDPALRAEVVSTVLTSAS